MIAEGAWPRALLCPAHGNSGSAARKARSPSLGLQQQLLRAEQSWALTDAGNTRSEAGYWLGRHRQNSFA